MTSLEIDAFLTVHYVGSITKAAEQLYISQSSLSIRLRTLEKELGCTLFERGRGSRAMALTPEGERFLPLALQHRELEERMRALGKSQPIRQVLRVSSINSIGSCLLPPVYERFAQLWPDIRLQIKDLATRTALEAISRDELDLTFSTLSQTTEYVTAIPFLSEPMSLLCSARSDLSDPVPLEQLNPAHEVYSSWCADLQQWHRTAFGIDVEPQVQLELMSQIRVFAAQTGGWAVVPYSVANALLDAPNLRLCRPAFAIPDRRIYILCSRKTLDTAPVAHFLECLRHVMRERQMPGLLL